MSIFDIDKVRHEECHEMTLSFKSKSDLSYAIDILRNNGGDFAIKGINEWSYTIYERNDANDNS